MTGDERDHEKTRSIYKAGRPPNRYPGNKPVADMQAQHKENPSTRCPEDNHRRDLSNCSKGSNSTDIWATRSGWVTYLRDCSCPLIPSCQVTLQCSKELRHLDKGWQWQTRVSHVIHYTPLGCTVLALPKLPSLPAKCPT